MNYGYFDDFNKEYVITKPDTPTPWTNFLGSRKYGAIITNNAAGYSFYNSNADGKITRFRFNACYPDMPGRYIYIRDNEKNDFWSTSWQPTGKSLDEYKTECRHGTGYTIINSSYDNIQTETTYFVPLNSVYELWKVSVKNKDCKPRNLSLFSYLEFSNFDEDKLDMNDLQFTQYISKTFFENNCIIQSINESNIESKTYRFFGLCGIKADNWDGNRENFIGKYGSYGNPQAVQNGFCTNKGNYTGNSCGSFQINIKLEANEEKELLFVLGPGNKETAFNIMEKYCFDLKLADKELEEIKQYWHKKIEKFKVETPSKELNSMLNTWHSYECFMNTYWSRTASLIYVNGRNGFGYRDTIVDIQSILHLDEDLARERLIMILSGQNSNGGALPLIDFNFVPHSAECKKMLPGTKEYLAKTNYPNYRCDDCLWLFNVVDDYMKTSGEKDFLSQNIPYSDKGEATVFEHLHQALLFIIKRLGSHHLVTAIDNDWNDCLKLGEKGESSFASMQLYLALNIFSKFSEMLGKKHLKKWALNQAENISKNIEKYCWKGDRYNRAILENNSELGNPNDEEAFIWLTPQVWAIISKLADNNRAEKLLEIVRKYLKTEYGTLLFYPSFEKNGSQETLMNLYPKGIKENGSIFLFAQAWAIQAEAMLKHGNNAWNCFNSVNPASYNDRAELHQAEPYVFSQFVDGIESPNFGRANGHWLTGTASTLMVAVIEHILGLKTDFDGIIIDPCIPSEWDNFHIHRYFRKKLLNIEIKNPNHVENGIISVFVNGIEKKDNKVLVSELTETNFIKVIMG